MEPAVCFVTSSQHVHKRSGTLTSCVCTRLDGYLFNHQDQNFQNNNSHPKNGCLKGEKEEPVVCGSEEQKD